MIENNNGDYAILFVDDEEKALKYFSKAVGGRYPVLTAADVDSAEEILKDKSKQIAVVISDQRMPGKNGVELLKKVRASYPGIVRMLTTAYSDLNDAIDAINRGEIYRYIQKPWKVESLQAEVKGAMDYFYLQRERDLLLAEKLSARQRMVGIERLAQLIVFARTESRLRNTDYAMRDFLEHLHLLPGTWESDSLSRVDQWEFTKWETKRITDYLRGATSELSGSHPEQGFADSCSAAQLAELNGRFARESRIELAIEQATDKASGSWVTSQRLLETILRNAFGIISQLQTSGNPVSLKLSDDEGRTVGGQALALEFWVSGPEWPGDRHLVSGSAMTEVHPVYRQMLVCSLAAAHHGGRCLLSLDSDQLVFTIILPVCSRAESLALPELGWEWLPDVLSNYEPSIDEFYSNL
ncbi:response regulator [Proteobacteria bacterium 005FR1]|nr:response regulator [Proteobacteria bacterium 005FR1]